MNVHHLELFFYVAKFEGITEAARKMPYGIQQPALSGQILQLERDLGVKLFHRRPFALTPPGRELYEFALPFFSRLEEVAERLRGEEDRHLRLAASAAAFTHHLPDILRLLRAEFPGLRLTLREMFNTELDEALRKREIDLAVSVLNRKYGPGVKSVKIIELPLVLAAPRSTGQKRFRDIAVSAERGRIPHPLVSLPADHPLSRQFQRGLASRDLQWEPTMEVTEIGLAVSYVDRGFGCGVAVDIPGMKWPAGVRKVPLPADFPKLSIGALHCGELKPVALRFLALLEEHAATLQGGTEKASAERED